MFSCAFCWISKNTFSYRTPPVTASEISKVWTRHMTEKATKLQIRTCRMSSAKTKFQANRIFQKKRSVKAKIKKMYLPLITAFVLLIFKIICKKINFARGFFLWATLLLATPGWNRQKIKQTLSNTQRLNFSYLAIIYILHLRYHQKIMGNILKNK